VSQPTARALPSTPRGSTVSTAASGITWTHPTVSPFSAHSSTERIEVASGLTPLTGGSTISGRTLQTTVTASELLVTAGDSPEAEGVFKARECVNVDDFVTPGVRGAEDRATLLNRPGVVEAPQHPPFANCQLAAPCAYGLRASCNRRRHSFRSFRREQITVSGWLRRRSGNWGQWRWLSEGKQP